jgi:hypothetical protein
VDNHYNETNNTAENVMTYNQVSWAEEHDWFIIAFEEGDNLWSVMVKDEEQEDGRRLFSDFAELKAWAGY